MNLNQLTIIGFIGQNADTKQLASGTTVTKFSVATTRSWKDDKGEWKQRTQWHNVLAFGHGFAQLASRLVKGTHVFVQGELTTREYDRTVSVPSGKKSVERVSPGTPARGCESIQAIGQAFRGTCGGGRIRSIRSDR